MLRYRRALGAVAMLALASASALHIPKAIAQATQLPPGEVCFQATTGVNGMVGTLGAITGGFGGTAGTYTNAPLTGGLGTGATGNVTVAGGAVTQVAILSPGINYVVGDVLSASSASIGNVSGFSVPVASISINSSLAGGTVGFYIPGTLSIKQTWQDAGETILNTNPVALDANGCALIYGSGAYRQILKDSLGNTVWDQPTTAAGNSSWAGTSTGTANAQVVSPAGGFVRADGQSISFIAGFTNTSELTVTPDGGTPINVYKDLIGGPVPTTGGEIQAGDLITLFYSTTLGAFHFTTPPIGIGITGEIRTFAFSACPAGWLEANGGAVSRLGATAGLFAAIGTAWGTGDGTTTFNIPALRGKFLRDWDDGAGVDPARAFASTQTGNIAQTVGTSAGTVTGTMSGTATGAGQVLELTSGSLNTSGGSNVNTQSALTVTGTITGTETGTATVGTGTDTRPINAAVLFCIKQ